MRIRTRQDLVLFPGRDHAVLRHARNEDDWGVGWKADRLPDDPIDLRQPQRLQPGRQLATQLIERGAPLLCRAPFGQLVLLPHHAEAEQDDSGGGNQNGGQKERDAARSPAVVRGVHRRILPAAGAFCVNFLHENQTYLSNRFAGRDPERSFDDIPLYTAVTGAPVFAESLGFVDCRIVNAYDGGDHTIFLGEVVQLGAADPVLVDGRELSPLIYYKSKYSFLNPA